MRRHDDSSHGGERARRVLDRVFEGQRYDLIWVPSDETEVFSVGLASGKCYVLKMGRPEECWPVEREMVVLPYLRARGIPVLDVKFSSQDFPELVEPFHITEAVPDVPLNQLDASTQRRLMRKLGRTLRQLEQVSWLGIPGSLPPEGAVKYVGGWWKRIYAQYRAGSSCPAWTIPWIHKIYQRLSELPQHFGGWQNQLLADSRGSFVLIDWPVAGADWFASGITSAMALIPDCKSDQPHVLLNQLLAGYSLTAPLTDREWEELRLMFIHSRLGHVAATAVLALNRNITGAWDAVVAATESKDVHDWLRPMLSTSDAMTVPARRPDHKGGWAPGLA